MSEAVKEAEKNLEEEKKVHEEAAANGEFYEDEEALFEEDIERDLIDMIKDDMPKGMFVSSCEAMLGPDWAVVGEDIVREAEPELLGKFLAYAD